MTSLPQRLSVPVKKHRQMPVLCEFSTMVTGTGVQKACSGVRCTEDGQHTPRRSTAWQSQLVNLVD